MIKIKEENSKKLTKKVFHCLCKACGNRELSPADIMLATPVYLKTRDTIGYICADCMEIGGYSLENRKERENAYNYDSYTYSFELECIPNSKSAHGLLISREYDFYATYDSSINSFGGAEFKTPIYGNLHGLKQIFRTVEENTTVNENCGSHINVGHDYYMAKYINVLRNNASNLFNPLCEYMVSHRINTINVFGRYFNDYCDIACCNGDYINHYNWLNLINYNRVEFRLCKFVDAKQYFWLTNLCSDILNTIFKNLDKGVEYSKIGQKLVKIFIKYAAGKAPCQAPHRNKA